ncbi:ABC transporter permease [Streptomyces sp. SID4956]|uniref:ABC transporter permease n=1 Tax=Streptomyces sp. SID4956 TaxID=2690290 RepID=UPI00136A2EC7|nr:hypothetical protein [Streptomyces sp. SID4956]
MEAAVPPEKSGAGQGSGNGGSALAVSGPKKYVFLVVFPFLMAMLLVGTYAGSMHSPSPKDMPVAVVGDSARAGELAAGLDKAEGSPVDTRVVATVDEARQLLHDREIAGAFVLPTGAGGDATLYTASAAGAAQAGMVKAVFEPVAESQHLDLAEKDIAPLPAHDGMGITSLFVAVGWMLAGYLVVTVVTSAAPELSSLRRLVPLMAAWAALISVVTWLLAGPLIGAIEGHAAAVLGLGWLSIFSVAMAQTLLSRLMGPLAVLPGITLFMFLGVPASNLSMSQYAVPGFFRFLHDVLPLPAAGEALRGVLYFGGDGAGPHLAVLAAWAVAGIALTAGVDLLRRRGKAAPGRDRSGANPSVADALTSV